MRSMMYAVRCRPTPCRPRAADTMSGVVANNPGTLYGRVATVERTRAATTARTTVQSIQGGAVTTQLEPSLLQRIAAGDQSAVARCLDQYGGLVWSLARRLTPNESDAEDAVQEIFVEIWRSANRFDPAKASEATFVAMLARRRLIDRLRRHNRRPIEEELDDSMNIAPSAETEAQIGTDVARVARAMAQMKPEQQQALHLSAWLGMSHSAVAEAMDLPLGTVKSHIRRGLLALREQLGSDVTTGTVS